MDGDKVKWWQKTVVYQIYPRSFNDTTGNGIGDLRGIIEKLDYLEDLGVETIWISPFFKSPQKDHGYDVSDFRSIDPVYGTLRDFDELLSRIHNKNMKMVLDLVLNHTSDEHPWFRESSSSRGNSKRNWYIWRDGRKSDGKRPPNNWKSMTGGSAWKYDNLTDQWYYFHFLPFQPDLNYRNPEVKEEMFNTMRFWLDKGVDGFRLDILHSIYEDEELRNDKLSWRLLPSDKHVDTLFYKHKYDLNLPETFDFAMDLRCIMDEYEPERFLVGEVFGTIEELARYYGPNNNGLHTVFLFEFTSTIPSFKPKKIRRIISRVEDALPTPFTPTYVYGNHDRNRYISLVNNDIQKTKLLVMLQLTLRGIPFIYYGEEIGMSNVFFNLKESQDPIAQKLAFFPVTFLARVFGFSLTRDRCRTPMQWTSEQNAGFSVSRTVEPWLRIPDSYKMINVEKEKEDPSSLFNFYRKLLKIRIENRPLSEGAFEFIDVKKLKNKCLAYRRYIDNVQLDIYLNFNKTTIMLDYPNQDKQLLFSTLINRVDLDLKTNKARINLSPFEGIILK
ncbi:MAG: alpha-glucosidase [Candidatus Hodarchaeota archaeon]